MLSTGFTEMLFVAQLIVRNLELEVKARLQRRAALHGQSMEEEARDILRDALKEETPSAGALGTEITALFRNIGWDDLEIEAGMAEFRGHGLKPVEFDE